MRLCDPASGQTTQADLCYRRPDAIAKVGPQAHVLVLPWPGAKTRTGVSSACSSRTFGWRLTGLSNWHALPTQSVSPSVLTRLPAAHRSQGFHFADREVGDPHLQHQHMRQNSRSGRRRARSDGTALRPVRHTSCSCGRDGTLWSTGLKARTCKLLPVCAVSDEIAIFKTIG